MGGGRWRSLRPRHFSTVLPSIPARILSNGEVLKTLQNKKLAQHLDLWRRSAALKLDLLLLRDEQDASSSRPDKGIIALARSRVRLQGKDEIDLVFCVLNLPLDRENKPFWREQGQRLADAI